MFHRITHTIPRSSLRPERLVLVIGRRHIGLLSSSNRLQPPQVNSCTSNHPNFPRLSRPTSPQWRPALSSPFHSTPSNHGGPVIVLLASFLKASTGFELARMASRVVLTFFPILLWKNMKSRRIIKYAAIHGIPALDEHQKLHMKRIRSRTRLLQVILAIPMILFWATIVASLECTPLTGRVRMILLSPEEEDEIAARLAGPGWYRAVGEILATEGSPRIIPTTDWRYQWVQDTLRRLEATIPVLAREPELCPDWAERDPDSLPLPPPAQHPLRPRPRASEYLRWVCDKMVKDVHPPLAPRPVAGAPYSLLLVDKPDASNAFSYGFGPDGGSGIVVYSGFLDDIFAHAPLQYSTSQQAPSFWKRIFGGVTTTPPRPTPTPEQTTELAILLAHEMAHLILAHHLESLSSVTVIVPGALSILSDIIRVLIFPATMMFGPFVNDAVAQLGKVGSGELLKISEACSSTKQEIEADVVSARLLAYAGFDAREAVTFWEDRATQLGCSKPDPTGSAEPPITPKYNIARNIMGNSHPVHELRIGSLIKELKRWEDERQKALASRPN